MRRPQNFLGVRRKRRIRRTLKTVRIRNGSSGLWSSPTTALLSNLKTGQRPRLGAPEAARPLRVAHELRQRPYPWPAAGSPAEARGRHRRAQSTTTPRPMVRECVIPDCGTHARFNHPGETHGVYCSKHKEEGMRNVVHKPCAAEGCATLAVFNQPGAGAGLYCGQHKPPGFVNVKDRKCQAEGCGRMPNFNFPGEKGGIFCSAHKLDGMIDIKHKRCMAPNCNKRPSFNYTGEMRALYCGPHKLEGMVNVDQERRSCNRAKFADGGTPEANKRMRSIGYATKQQGYSLEQHKLAGPMDPSLAVQAQQPFDCGSDQQAVSIAGLTAAYPSTVTGGNGAVLLPVLNNSQGQGLGTGDGEQQMYSNGQQDVQSAGEQGPDVANLGHHQQAQQQQPQQQQPSGLSFLTSDGLQGHEEPQNAHSQPLPFLMLPQTSWKMDGSVEHQQAQQQQNQQQAQVPFQDMSNSLHLPSPTELNNLVTGNSSPSKDENGAPSSGFRNLSHIMHMHMVEFLREHLRRPEVQRAMETKTQVCCYIDAFTTWDPTTRVEQYTLLHFDWDLGADKWQAVLDRINKALPPS